LLGISRKLLFPRNQAVDLDPTLCLASAAKVDLFPSRFLRLENHLKWNLHSWLTAKHGPQTLMTRDNLLDCGSHPVSIDFAVN
jgi:hypothetical protein